MQEILAEVAYYALQDFDQTSFGIDRDASFSSSRLMFQSKRDIESKKKHLLSLLQMVYPLLLIICLILFIRTNQSRVCVRLLIFRFTEFRLMISTINAWTKSTQ